MRRGALVAVQRETQYVPFTMSEVPPGLPPQAECVSRGGFNLHAGPVWRLPADGEVRRFALVVAEKHMNYSGSVHGGLIMTFADVAMSQTARAVSGAPMTNTISMTCDFVGPGKLGDILEARVRVTRQTRTMVFLLGDIVAGERAVAVATGLWKIA
jgi:uncharacterized protein (TIGR00369 family)